MNVVLAVLSLFLLLLAGAGSFSAEKEEVSYVLLGVSGTLQDGFELRHRLDFVNDASGARHEAVLVGKALVRGYKAFLDVKEPGWREYVAEPEAPKVPNAIVLPTGCFTDANLYWLYFVPEPQLFSVLAFEPRFLAISPDTGLVDLSSPYTDATVRKILQSEAVRLRVASNNESLVAVPLVTGVWFQSSFVESPPVHVLEDGTQITSYEGSLAQWAGVDPAEALVSANEDQCSAKNDAWQAVYQAIRQAENQPPTTPHPIRCDDSARFGVGQEHARINYPFAYKQMNSLMLMD